MLRCFAATCIFILIHTTALAADGAAAAERPVVGDWSPERIALRPVPLGDVKVGGFLGERIRANHRTGLPAGLASPIPRAIEARSRGEEPPPSTRRLATDSDFYKWLEGASYAMAYDPPLSRIRGEVARYARMLADLQEPSGYLGTRLSPAAPFDQRVWHDLYVAGHFIEAAVAHFRASGDRILLSSARKLADFYIRAWEAGHPYFEGVGRREHPEIELALVRLYRATGERRFLDFAAAVTRMARIAPRVADVVAGGGNTHAVRFCYLMTGAAEVFIETGDESFYRHLPALWEQVVSKRMYVTGGIGASERIPAKPYHLPQTLKDNPRRDIAETCASVALMMFSWRLHAITGESRYMDVIETVLYNHYLGAISADHLGNFYYNPLRRVGDLTGVTDHDADPVRRTRLPKIHTTACCLPNAWRFFGQLPEYVFSASNGRFAVNLYTAASARHRMAHGTRVVVETETAYPREGEVTVTVSPERPVRLVLELRIPSWCGGASVTVSGEPTVSADAGGYHRIDRVWRPGDRVRLVLPMSPVALISRPEIAANRGQVAFRRGPLVYCLEKQDAAGLDLEDAVLVVDREDPSRSVRARYDGELGMYVLEARAGRRRPSVAPESSYFRAPPLALSDVREVRLVPFYFRANRDDDTRWITWLAYE